MGARARLERAICVRERRGLSGVLVKSIAVVGVPTSAGAHAAGQERAPEAFRLAGVIDLLAERGFDVHDSGDLSKVRWTPDPASPRAQRAEAVSRVASAVADVVDEAAASADAVLVLGGDCTIEVGVVAAFARRPERIGLLYLDAGPDLNVPSAVRLGFLDWMGTAHLLGLPEATTALGRIGPRFPLLQPDQIVFVAAIPDELTGWEHRVVAEKELAVLWVDDVKGRAPQAAMKALGRFEHEIDRLLVHFDVDVIDFTDFPAADFPTINAGLTLTEAIECIEVFARHPKFAALTVSEFNPDHVDEERALVRAFVARLVDALPSPTAA
jgi:arginase